MSEDKFISMWECDAERIWHIPHAKIMGLREAFGGLYSFLEAQNIDLSCGHYMLKGWKTKDNRPRKANGGGIGKIDVTPQAVEERALRAMANEKVWKNPQGESLLKILEDEGHSEVPCKMLDYWISRLGWSFQQLLTERGIVGRDHTVHHIIAQDNRGIVSFLSRLFCLCECVVLFC